METLFGPPIPSEIPSPIDRPLATALILDVSTSAYGNRRVVDLFKTSLVNRFANMEYDNVLLFNGECYEYPGVAVAAIRSYSKPVRHFNTSLTEAVKALSSMDRIYRRQLLLITDQFSDQDVVLVNNAIERNAVVLSDIAFYSVAYGPKYTRRIVECSWNAFFSVNEPVELDKILKEVCGEQR